VPDLPQIAAEIANQFEEFECRPPFIESMNDEG